MTFKFDNQNPTEKGSTLIHLSEISRATNQKLHLSSHRIHKNHQLRNTQKPYSFFDFSHDAGAEGKKRGKLIPQSAVCLLINVIASKPITELSRNSRLAGKTEGKTKK